MLLALLACSQSFTSTMEDTPPLDDSFQDAAAEFGVPRDLLVAVSYAMTRMDHRMGMAATDSGIGLMHLREDGGTPSMQQAADLTGLSLDDLTNDEIANIRGGAAILAELAVGYGEWTGEEVDTLQEWYPVVARYSGATDPLIAEGFAGQVFDFMQWGLAHTTADGEFIEIAPHYFDWLGSEPRTGSSLITNYIPASSSNYTNSSRTSVSTVVIHTVEGSYSGAISWLQNSSASASAHYVIRSSDGEITQMVDEEDIAWHAGHWETNQNSIGIEHEGYVSQPDSWYTEAMYRASAALVRDICDRYGIPRDRDHIIGHYEVPGCAYSGGGSSCHTDPGSGWDWDRFIDLVNENGSPEEILESNLSDGPKAGHFSATVHSSRYGVTDTCSGSLQGSASSGRLYLAGTCRLDNHGAQSGDNALTFSGEVSGSEIHGDLAVEGYADTWSGVLNSDGSIAGSISGSKNIGGDVGELSYEASLTVNP